MGSNLYIDQTPNMDKLSVLLQVTLQDQRTMVSFWHSY